ncbi:hypothetical protein [Streptomyces sp. NPDC058371]|uniref:hypothetical protein n=1 Tax=Streptomyces sp. NPDC058371 TaxID=3346463 RepID=UPI003659EA5E
MAEVTGPGVDDARAWDERLGWAYGLIADDPAERAAAHARLSAAQHRAAVARDRFNEVWRLTAGLGAESPFEEPALLRAHEEYVDVRSHSLPDGLWDGRGTEDIVRWPGLPYALLFLEWEARYPQEWTRYAKAWGTKQRLLREVAGAGRDEAVRAKLVDLTETVVRRAYRCKDREYVRVARAVDGDELRERLTRAHRSDNPWARLHAGYVLWLLDHPDVPNTRHVWRTWLAAVQ